MNGTYLSVLVLTWVGDPDPLRPFLYSTQEYSTWLMNRTYLSVLVLTRVRIHITWNRILETAFIWVVESGFRGRTPGGPCHELTSSDNSTSMRIWLGRKESQCEGILPVSLHRWHCQQHHYLSSSSSTPSVTRYEMWHKRKLMRCSIAPWKTEKHSIKNSK